MWRQVCFAGMLMVMVIYSALVRSHQSTSLVASASCVPRGYNTRAQPCLKMWRGSPVAGKKNGLRAARMSEARRAKPNEAVRISGIRMKSIVLC